MVLYIKHDTWKYIFQSLSGKISNQIKKVLPNLHLNKS